MKKSRTLAPSKYLRKYGKAKISRPMITKEEVEAVLECAITDERYEELLEASRLYSLSNSDKHVNLAQDAEHRQDWEGAKKHWKNAALASIKHDTIHKTQRSDKLKVRGITMRKEEVEQIDELSSDTLRSYERKATGTAQQFFAAHDRGARAARLTPPPSDRSITKRLKGRLTALSKLHARNEEVEQIDELSKGTLKKYIHGAVKSAVGAETINDFKDGQKNANTIMKRHKGIKTAKQKLKTESVEQIDELSTEKKKQYIKRAEQSEISHSIHARYYKKRAEKSTNTKSTLTALGHRSKHLEKRAKRAEGQRTAKASIKASMKSEAVEKEAVEKEVNHYEIVNNRSKAVVGKAKTLKRARNIVDKKDNEYGGYAHFHRPVFKEAVELSASRKDKVNSLLAKHQAKGLPKKTAKKYTREYTGDGLPLIAAVINQEETLNETKE